MNSAPPLTSVTKSGGTIGVRPELAMWLAREQVFLSANTSAMNGWFARADRLLPEVEPCVEQGWLALFRASLLASASGD